MSLFRRHSRGVANIEFALVAPIMLVLIFATVEIANVLRAQAKVSAAAGLLAELVAGDASVTAPAGTLADGCIAATLQLTPYPTAYLAADVASITNDHPANRVPHSTDVTTLQTYLDWESVSSCPAVSPAMSLSGAYSLANGPGSLLTRSGSPAASNADLAYSYSAVVVRVTYGYRNFVAFFLGQTITLTATAVARPRSNVTIACSNVARTAACPQVQ